MTLRTITIPPDTNYVTTTVYGDGTTTTFTIPPTGESRTGIVVVQLPYGTTTTITSTGAYPILATQTLKPDRPGDPIHVVVQKPGLPLVKPLGLDMWIRQRLGPSNQLVVVNWIGHRR